MSVIYAGSVLVARSHTRVAFLALLVQGRRLGVDVHSDQGRRESDPGSRPACGPVRHCEPGAWHHCRAANQDLEDVLTKGALLGLLYGSAQILQTAGLAHTAASVSGFITGLYVVATPLLAAVIPRRRIAGVTWLAVLLAMIALAILSLRGFTLRLR